MATEWINDLRVVDLKDELKKRELPVSGKKSELAARLKEAVKAQAEDEVAEVEAANAQDAELTKAAEDGGQAVQAASKQDDEALPAGAAEPENDKQSAEKEPGAGSQAVLEGVAQPPTIVSQREASQASEDANQKAQGEGDEAKQETLDAVQQPTATANATDSQAAGRPAHPVSEDLELLAEAKPGTPAEEEAAAVAAQSAASNERHDAEPVPEIAEAPAAAAGNAARAVEEPVSATPLREERLPSMQAALLAPQAVVGEPAPDAEMEEAVDFEADDVEEAAAAAAPKAEQRGRDSSTAKKQREETAPAEGRESKRLKAQQPADLPRQDSGKRKREPIPVFKPRDKASPEEAVKSEAADGKPLEKRPSVFDRIGSLDAEEKRVGATGAPPTRTKPTRALLVNGFIRPFTLTAAQNLFKTYGEMEKMWMPVIRDKAYILFKSEEAAEAARQGTHGLEWPNGNRTSLRPKFIPVEEAEKMISSEGKDAPAPAAKPADLPGKSSGPTAASAANSNAGQTPANDRRRPERVNGPEAGSRQKSSVKPPPQKEKTLEDLFKKTDTAPHLYWLSLTDEQMLAKQKSKEVKTREDRYKPS